MSQPDANLSQTLTRQPLGLTAPPALLLALLLFLWTPPHFWSLATYRLEDYRRAGIPMLPVVVGVSPAARIGAVYVLATVLASLAFAQAGNFGLVYWSVAVLTGSFYLISAIFTILRPDASTARLHFRASVLYLAAVFGAMVVDTIFRT